MSNEVFHDSADEVPSNAQMYKILLEIQSNTSKILEENKALKNDYMELKASMDFQCQQFEDLKKENDILKKQAKDLGVTVCQLKGENAILRSQYEMLEDSIDEVNQYQRKNNIEIHGIPEQEGENLENLVVDLAKELGLKMETISIDIVHRLPRRYGTKPIIVKFHAYQDKYAMYQARYKLRKLKNKTYFQRAVNIYINENLTKTRKQLFAEVRKRRDQNEWHSAFTQDGKIYIKFDKESRPTKINNYSDLEKLCSQSF